MTQHHCLQQEWANQEAAGEVGESNDLEEEKREIQR
jgi:hypothetical protein